jgi:hypothetical protein
MTKLLILLCLATSLHASEIWTGDKRVSPCARCSNLSFIVSGRNRYTNEVGLVRMKYRIECTGCGLVNKCDAKTSQ